MATEYYWKRLVTRCSCCGQSLPEYREPTYEEMIIGKKVGGYPFLFREYPDKHLTSLREYLLLLSSDNGVIVNDQGEEISLEKFLSIIFHAGEPKFSLELTDGRSP